MTFLLFSMYFSKSNILAEFVHNLYGDQYKSMIFNTVK